MKITYIPSAYLICCEEGHDMQMFEDEWLCAKCVLTAEQIQRLTVGDGIPLAIFESEEE